MDALCPLSLVQVSEREIHVKLNSLIVVQVDVRNRSQKYHVSVVDRCDDVICCPSKMHACGAIHSFLSLLRVHPTGFVHLGVHRLPACFEFLDESLKGSEKIMHDHVLPGVCASAECSFQQRILKDHAILGYSEVGLISPPSAPPLRSAITALVAVALPLELFFSPPLCSTRMHTHTVYSVEESQSSTQRSAAVAFGGDEHGILTKLLTHTCSLSCAYVSGSSAVPVPLESAHPALRGACHQSRSLHHACHQGGGNVLTRELRPGHPSGGLG